MLINRHLQQMGLAAAVALSLGAGAVAPAQAQLSNPSLTPDQFASDLGFDNLKSRNLLEPSATLEELKRLITGESKAKTQAFLSQYQLDASKLFWNGVDPVEVYFINEGAAYRNQLLYSAYDDLGNLKKSEMIFSDISSKDSILRESNGALALGQGVNLGGFTGPTQLDFSIISDGFRLAKPGPNATAKQMQKYEAELAKRTLGTDSSQNYNGLQHVVAFQHNDWIILGFEDIVGGGDLDYNDVVFAVRGIQEGAPVADVPEPSAILGMVLVGLGGITSLRYRRAMG
jgi:hypothetical protein